MQIWLYFGELIVGLVVLYFGAEWLIKGGARIGMRLGMTPLVIGLTIVAFGTSAPELAVSIGAALKGVGGLAVGNVVGSNIFNISVVLAVCVLIRPLTVKVQLIRFDIPLLIVLSFLIAYMLRDGAICRLEGGFLTLGIITYTALSYYLARQKPAAEVLEEFEGDMPELRGSLWADFGWLAMGMLFLVGGSHLMVMGSCGIALELGISKTVVGLILVALGTSLPEVACSVMAATKDKGDIAIGNIVGSSIFNLLAILGATALINPFQAEDLQALELVFMVGLAVFLFPLARTGYSLRRWEGIILLVIYFTFLALRWPV